MSSLSSFTNTEIAIAVGLVMVMLDRFTVWTTKIITLLKPIPKANGKEINTFFRAQTEVLRGINGNLDQHRTIAEDKLKSIHGSQGDLKNAVTGIKQEIMIDNRLFDAWKNEYKDDFREIVSKLNQMRG